MQLRDTKARKTKITFVNYLATQMHKKVPHLLEFDKDLPHLDAAARSKRKQKHHLIGVYPLLYPFSAFRVPLMRKRRPDMEALPLNEVVCLKNVCNCICVHADARVCQFLSLCLFS